MTTSRVMRIHKVLHFPYNVRLHGFLFTGISVCNSVSRVLCTYAYVHSVQIINRTTGQHSASITFVEQAFAKGTSNITMFISAIISDYHHSSCIQVADHISIGSRVQLRFTGMYDINIP